MDLGADLTVNGFFFYPDQQCERVLRQHITNNPPTYTVSAADWLTLVEKFGLPADLEDTARKG